MEMAASRYQTKQYTADKYIESAGTIMFKISTKEICSVWSEKNEEWLLSEGKRNIRESRVRTAIRETADETGYLCYLLPVKMPDRCTQDGPEDGFATDEPRLLKVVCEPFVTTHQISPDSGVIKLIYWYIGAINEQEVMTSP